MNALEKAQYLKDSPTDITNFRDRYRVKFRGVIFTFDSFALKRLHLYYKILKQYSDMVDMKERYLYRPDYVAYDFYGTTNLGFILLYINDCRSAIEFDMDEIIVPNTDTLFETLSKVMGSYEIMNIDLIPVNFKYDYNKYHGITNNLKIPHTAKCLKC